MIHAITLRGKPIYFFEVPKVSILIPQTTERDKKKAEDKLEACRNVIATQKSRFERLSDKFSQLMERLGFAGQLYMVETEKPSCPYRMEVKVKFREQSDFSILHGSTQSGGEKAISTGES